MQNLVRGNVYWYWWFTYDGSYVKYDCTVDHDGFSTILVFDEYGRMLFIPGDDRLYAIDLVTKSPEGHEWDFELQMWKLVQGD